MKALYLTIGVVSLTACLVFWVAATITGWTEFYIWLVGAVIAAPGVLSLIKFRNVRS